MLIKIIILASVVGASVPAALAQQRGELTIETPLRERFKREKKSQEYIIFRKSKIRKSLTAAVSGQGYNLHWQVPVDCMPQTSKRYRGIFPEEILAQVGVDYNIKFSIYQNKNIVARPLYNNVLSICREHHRINSGGY